MTCGAGGEARGGRGLGRGRSAVKHLYQVMAMLSADLRRDMYIFIAAIVFLSVVYFLARFAEPWLN
jgi:hypothetical protein